MPPRGVARRSAVVAFVVLGSGALSLPPRDFHAVDFLRGDANADGQVDVSDAVRTLIALFVEPLGLPCDDAADVDDSGALEVTDAVALLGYLFRGQAPPAPPRDRCGEDPTGEDPLACAEYGACPPGYVPLFDASTPLEPAIVEDTPGALITRISDRARDRHAREARLTFEALPTGDQEAVIAFLRSL